MVEPDERQFGRGICAWGQFQHFGIVIVDDIDAVAAVHCQTMRIAKAAERELDRGFDAGREFQHMVAVFIDDIDVAVAVYRHAAWTDGVGEWQRGRGVGAGRQFQQSLVTGVGHVNGVRQVHRHPVGIPKVDRHHDLAGRGRSGWRCGLPGRGRPRNFWLKDQVTNGCEGHHDNDCSSSNG
ncbi:Uncharacterised protein [Mycobacterium tuberculosis]|uniref:Uncharacterized protein n=1 Tax=Mycobacterium tuberculosis TaxID=1773 RepID=A0A654TMM8_MYCTX|nr:Uncharacterised protein [Mycobacterium tuberculosis]